MAFFKKDENLLDKEPVVIERNRETLRYVVNSDGKGVWIKPYFLPYTEMDEDVPF